MIYTTKGLKCKECNREYPISPIHVCEFCFGPLEVVYHYDKIKKNLTREKIEERPKSMWRYRELLPLEIDGEEEEYSKALRYLNEAGVTVKLVERDVIE
jgi:threonine synthase